MTAPARTAYVCQRCGKPIDAREVHVKHLMRTERERVSPGGRRTITVLTGEIVAVTHLAPCQPEDDNTRSEN
jgi:hypothetical protein